MLLRCVCFVRVAFGVLLRCVSVVAVDVVVVWGVFVFVRGISDYVFMCRWCVVCCCVVRKMLLMCLFVC